MPRAPAIIRSSFVIATYALIVACPRASEGSAARTDWPTYGATYENTRRIELTAINSSTVGRLSEMWRTQLGSHERVETTPIVIGGTMYVTTGVGDSVVALDAATGKKKWRYVPKLGFISPCCGALNRGVAVSGNRVFVATMDARLIALDAKTGKQLWDTTIGDPKRGFSETMAPLAWDNRVFIGSSGSDYGIRGSLSAYAADTGKLLWRWYAVNPGWEGSYATAVHGMDLHRDIAREKRDAPKYRNAWQHGGGAVWMTPALDSQTGTLFVTTSNPSPVFNGSVRPGDNLYTESIVAVDARSGKMRWYYQQTPHDVWEYEPASPPILIDAAGPQGKHIAVVAEAGKTRWLYVVERRTGKLIRLSQSWTPNTNLYAIPKRTAEDDPLPLRGTIGPIAYDPQRHLALVTHVERPASGERWSDVLVAINTDNGRIAWKKTLGPPHNGVRGDPILAGSLSVADLVLVSDPFGVFSALRASDAQTLWQYQLGGDRPLDADAGAMVRAAHRVRDWLLPIKRALFHQAPPTQATAGVDANPIAYEVNGREYIAIPYDAQPERATGGAAISAFALPKR